MVEPRDVFDEIKKKAARPFINRETCIDAFYNAIEHIKDRRFALVFYGLGGIGKTSLRKELNDRLKKSYPQSVSATIDFKNHGLHDASLGLYQLRTLFRIEHKVEFPTFDFAYCIYWQKQNPQISLNSREFTLIEEGSLIADVISAFSELPLIGFIPKVASIVAKRSKQIETWWENRGKECLGLLAEMEPFEIEEALPQIFAEDLNRYLLQKGVPVVIFMDTFEAVWGLERSESKLFDRDEWVRQLILNLPDVLWVICGRERLHWAEDDPSWNEWLGQCLIEGLSSKDSKVFLTACGIEDVAIQRVISKGSRGIPFYLDLAVDTYFEIFAKNQRVPIPNDFANTPRKVLNRFLSHLSQNEEKVLKLISSARFWDKELFDQLCREFNISGLSTSEYELSRFSFMKAGDVPGTWHMHRVMQNGLQAHQDPELKRRAHEFLFNYYANQLRDIRINNITEMHKIAICEAFFHGSRILNYDQFLYWFLDVSKVFDFEAQWSLLITLYQDLSLLVKKQQGANHPEFAAVMNNLANLYKKQAKYSKAETVYLEALSLMESALGPDNPNILGLLCNLGELYVSEAKYVEAETLYKRALTTAEHVLEPGHPSIEPILSGLAMLYQSLGKYKEAECLLKRVLAIKERTIDKGCPIASQFDHADTLSNLALNYQLQGKYDEAIALYENVVALKETILDPDHTDLTYILNNLAVTYCHQKKYVEAEHLLKRVLSILEHVLEPDHPNIAHALVNLASIYREQRKYRQAEALFKRSLTIREESLSPYHPEVGNSLVNLACLYMLQGKFNKAESLCKKALTIREKSLGQNHPNVGVVLLNLAQVYFCKGKLDDAELACERALSIFESVHGSNHPDTNTVYGNLIAIRAAKGRGL